jgi:hypothetical protein
MKLKLKKEGELLSTFILDEEGDGYEVAFNYDMCATIKTDRVNEIPLHADTLFQLAVLVEEAEKIYDEQPYEIDSKSQQGLT